MLPDQSLTTYRSARLRLRLGDADSYTSRIARLHAGSNARQRIALEALIEADGATHLFALQDGRLVAGDADMLEAA